MKRSTPDGLGSISGETRAQSAFGWEILWMWLLEPRLFSLLPVWDVFLGEGFLGMEFQKFQTEIPNGPHSPLVQGGKFPRKGWDPVNQVPEEGQEF